MPVNDAQLHELRNELARLTGEVSAIDANLERLNDHVREELRASKEGAVSEARSIHAKLDTLLGIHARTEDHTARIKTLETRDYHESKIGIRIALTSAGVVTGAGALLTLLKLLGRI